MDYKMAYEAGKQDTLNEFRYLMYGDICGAMIGLMDEQEISEDIYKKVMKVIDKAFDKE